MAIEPTARQELNRRMEERRAKLGLRWRDVADAANVTTEGLRGVRTGPSSIPAFTRRAIERALQWPDYEVDRILDDTAAAPADDEIPPDYSAETRQRMITMTVKEALEFVKDEWVKRGDDAAKRAMREIIRVREEAGAIPIDAGASSNSE